MNISKTHQNNFYLFEFSLLFYAYEKELRNFFYVLREKQENKVTKDRKEETTRKSNGHKFGPNLNSFSGPESEPSLRGWENLTQTAPWVEEREGKKQLSPPSRVKPTSRPSKMDDLVRKNTRQ